MTDFHAEGQVNISIFRIIFSRFFVMIAFLVLQFYFIFWIGVHITENNNIMLIVSIINIFLAIILINRTNQKNEYKIVWLILMAALPGCGFIIYLLFNGDGRLFNKDKKVIENINKTYKYVSQSKDYINQLLKKENETQKKIINLFINNGFEPYINNDFTYLETGESYFDALIKELSKAQDFIFIEYCIIKSGKLWENILKVLKEKADSGVKVFVMYDGLNNLFSFDADYFKKLDKTNIKSKMFEPLFPFLTSTQNNRDHRKVVVIDNKVAFTGGVNIGDEYANLYTRFGYWKDGGVMIKGDSAIAFSAQYLHIYNLSFRKNRRLNIDKYLKINNTIIKKHKKTIKNNESFIVPICDYPCWKVHMHELLFKTMINTAKDSIYITTPYLILDSEMINSIKGAALKGLHVNIIVPKIPDKEYAYILTRNHFEELIKANVNVYQYTPGFMHMKSCIIDNEAAYIGTCNFDYRSLYLHYENGAYIYDKDFVGSILKDIKNELKKSHNVSMKDIEAFSIWQKILGPLFKVIAPLM